ncbi:MAG: GGDEF domain-containing protein [Rhodospirillales bacterium]|nr:GGDEF domain-containing protein [Rhodospirillales bacterium]
MTPILIHDSLSRTVRPPFVAFPHPPLPTPRHSLERGASLSRPSLPGEAPDDLVALLERLDFAFQPIVNIHTGSCAGYEVLLRGVEGVGFATIAAFLDHFHDRNRLAEVETQLRRKAMMKFARLPDSARQRLFFNVDNRVFAETVGALDRLQATAALLGLPPTAIVLEISESHPFPAASDPTAAIRALKRETFKIALDDFGAGFSGLKMLYVAEPDFLKIDRFFITDIATDSKKKLFLAHIVNVAHVLGIEVIAEGVETEHEFFMCKEIGCDLVQGYLIQKPTTDLAALSPHSVIVEGLSRRERRARDTDQRIIVERIESIPPMPIESDMVEVFHRFRDDKALMILPLIDSTGAPLGIIRERELKEFVYSAYGKDIIRNKTFGYRPAHFLQRCPIADIHTPAERILEMFSAADGGSEGVLVVEDMRYAGFLSAQSLLKVINEKNLTEARDQNPLTKLPGNGIIMGWIAEALQQTVASHVFVYFDFDHFKPFNDAYGFRRGDRAILLFAEILSKSLAPLGCRIGHIGGDDFFVCFRDPLTPIVEAMVLKTIALFAHDVESFYDDADRQRRGLAGCDREGNHRTFPLLAVSAAVLEVPAASHPVPIEDIGTLIAQMKKNAKASPDKLCAATLLPARGPVE